MPMVYKVGLFFAWLYVAMAFLCVYGGVLCDYVERKVKAFIQRIKTKASERKAQKENLPEGLPILE